MKKFTRIAAITAVILALIGCLTETNYNPQVRYIIKKESLLDRIHNKEYAYLIEYIKQHEGYVGIPYTCPAGHLTIGYGHVIQPKESISELSKYQAEELLKTDLGKAIKLAEKLNPELNKLQILAIGHFIYSLGVGYYSRSELKRLIDQGDIDLDKLMEIWSKYSYYKNTSGVMVFSKNAYDMRLHEYNLFKSGLIIESQYREFSKDKNIVFTEG